MDTEALIAFRRSLPPCTCSRANHHCPACRAWDQKTHAHLNDTPTPNSRVAQQYEELMTLRQEIIAYRQIERRLRSKAKRQGFLEGEDAETLQECDRVLLRLRTQRDAEIRLARKGLHHG